MDWKEDLLKNSKLHGEYYTLELKNYFSYGELIKVYSHYSYRLFTISKDQKIYRIHNSEFGQNFFTKEEWRNKQINKIIKN
jgi:hypothetical protein